MTVLQPIASSSSSTDRITNGDSSVIVEDTGNGSINIIVDGNIVFSVKNGGIQLNEITTPPATPEDKMLYVIEGNPDGLENGLYIYTALAGWHRITSW